MVEGIPMSSGRFQYIQLSTRRFVEDELFTLVSFDHLTLQRMYLHVALKCQRDPTRFERYSAISEGSLLEALQNKKLHRQGRATVTHDDSSTDSDFLKTVELSTGVIWGSDAEQEQCRRRAFAYQARYVQPALFVTLTPTLATRLFWRTTRASRKSTHSSTLIWLSYPDAQHSKRQAYAMMSRPLVCSCTI
ncbi:hypothetical protein F444_20044 [Phytophthora nicotianae P1976]|uniref:Helitron helicase-like domain-containing protein n=1 Tax=Phytophthora nicotianae P1976 TaxID=1317066 RepID=A0A080Z5U6_PHYNI|nr:hypothetical protein F444_20044 [Phytophthora nicotianae P1976]